MEWFRRLWWVFLLLFSGVLGCTGTIKTAQIELDFQTIPEDIATYKSTMPGLEISYTVDPWLAIEKLIEGVGDLFGEAVPGS